ncbi:hypothetical protein Hdeb2414_s0005g00164521 [Helianthus debilis subsp. tardiflorus]
MEQHLHEKTLAENQESEFQNDDVEALSLCDLATNESHDPQQQLFDEPEFDFAFSCGSSSSQPENNMCSADELFFGGRILPLRHSVTLPSRFVTQPDEFIFTRSISVSISEPVSVATSRSSSARSSTSLSEFNGYRTRNQFHSHPSPTPHVRTRIRNFSNSNKSSSKWRFLQLGPLKPQEIGLADLKNRSLRSNGSGRMMKNEDEKKKKHVLSCKCSAEDVIESTVSSRISMVNERSLNEEETKTRSKESNVGRRKHVVSLSGHHRTSEWLKQLFVQKNDPL